MTVDEATGIAALWAEALKRYSEATGKDINTLPRFSNKSDVERFTEEHTKRFNDYRNPESSAKVNKLRSILIQNVEWIQSGAQQLSGAASSAFPPSSAITTAFLWMLQACNAVHADYDSIVGFFDEMHSFLERVGLVEKKLPNMSTYQTILMRVFSSFLELIGISTQYVQRKRFKQWLKALVDGNDPSLKDALDGMNTSISRLESATSLVTMGNTQDLKKDTYVIRGGLNMLQADTGVIANDVQDIKLMSQRLQTGLSEWPAQFQQMSANFEKMLVETQKANKKAPHKSQDPSEQRHEAFNQVKQRFFSGKDPSIHVREIEHSFIKDSAQWIFSEPAWTSWVDGKNPVLLVSGESGYGKTGLLYSAVEELKKTKATDRRTSVAYFYFRDDDQAYQYYDDALCCSVIQIAEQDPVYCQQVAAELANDEKYDSVDIEDSGDVWTEYIAKRFPQNSEAHLYLVFDGLDEAMCWSDFQTCLNKLGADKPNVHIMMSVCASSTEETKDCLAEAALHPEVVEVTKEKISGDIKKIIQNRFKYMSRIRNFRAPVKRTIANTLLEKADGMLYVEHILRRYNAIGREGAVLKDMEQNLPKDLHSLYDLLLGECQERRSDEELRAMRHLFAWVAFCERPINLREATDLITLADEGKVFSLDEELAGRSSRLIELAVNNPAGSDSADDDWDFESSPTEKKDNDTVSGIEDDWSANLRFHERALREYFGLIDKKEEAGLRTSKFSGNLIILEMCTRILCHLSSEELATVSDKLKDYAAYYWIDHFGNLEVESNDADEHEVARVVNCVSALLQGRGFIAKCLEDSESTDDYSTLFSGEYTIDILAERYASWATKATGLDAEKVSLDEKALQWAKETLAAPKHVYFDLARAHTRNWFSHTDKEKALIAAEFAIEAISLGPTDDDTVRVAREAIQRAEKSDDDSVVEVLSAEQLRQIANYFEDIEKDAAAHRGIAFAMDEIEAYAEAIVDLSTALTLCKSDDLRLPLLIELGRANYNSELYEDANKSLKEALAVAPKDEDTGLYKDDVRHFVRQALVAYGNSLCEQEKEAEAIAAYEEARTVSPNEQMLGDDLESYAEVFINKEAWDDLVTTLEKWTFFDLMTWLTKTREETHATFQKATKLAGKIPFMLTTYEQAIRYLNSSNSSAPIVLHLADAHANILGDDATAKKLIYEALDSETPEDEEYLTGESAFETLYTARDNLTDILFREFRAATNGTKKVEILKELRAIPERRLARMIVLDNTTETRIAAIVLQMIQKVGTPLEFQDFAEKTFRACVDALNDTYGGNDMGRVILLSQVLAVVGGLDRDARIAYSCCFSKLSSNLNWDSDEEDEDEQEGSDDGVEGGNEEETHGEAEGEGEDDESDDGEEKEDDDEAGTKDEEEEEEEEEDSGEGRTDWDEDLAPEWVVVGQCNGECKQEDVSSWKAGALHLCIHCANVWLCDSCYAKRQAYNRGEEMTSWASYCGLNHRYIKGPMEGWRGVKGGVMTMGDTKVKFADWIKGLGEERWPQAWEGFWTREERGEDIL